MQYDSENIFAKILRQELPYKKVKEGEHFLAFHDAFPKTAIHILVIPKKPYINFHEFIEKAQSIEVIDFYQGIKEIVKEFNLEDIGYRLITNTGKNGAQEVFHFHMHIVGGQHLGPIVSCARKEL